MGFASNDGKFAMSGSLPASDNLSTRTWRRPPGGQIPIKNVAVSETDPRRCCRAVVEESPVWNSGAFSPRVSHGMPPVLPPSS